jgi:hypothetical protein
MAGRVSQEVIESSVSIPSAARVTQSIIEPYATFTPLARVSQVAGEVQVTGSPIPRVSQLVTEVQGLGSPVPRVTQAVVEVLIINLEVPVLPIYPTLKGLGFNVKWRPQFFNMPTQTTTSGADIDLGLADTPLHDFVLTYDVLPDRFGDTDFKTLMGFFLMMRGTLGRFLFKNPDDNEVVGQSLTTTDGINSLFGPLQRTYGANGYTSTEPVGYVDVTQPFNLYANGVLQSPDTYSLVQTTPCDVQVKFNNTPTAGLVLTCDMSYFYYCKFAESASTFEKFMHQLWLVSQVNIHSCRPGA